jgi:hypothetical protein
MFNDIGPGNTRVQLDDSSDEIACLVNHLYGGDGFPVDIDNLLPCSRMAHKCDVPSLQKAIDAFVEQLALSESNVAHYTVVACDNPAMHKLMDRCGFFLAWQLEKVCCSR